MRSGQWPLGVRDESERDRPESPFAALLRRIYVSDPSVEAVVFVDDEGECVDYIAATDPHWTQVVGAQLVINAEAVRQMSKSIEGGRPVLATFCGEQKSFACRFVGEYLLVVGVEGSSVPELVCRELESTTALIRDEAKLLTPLWEPHLSFEVQTRAAAGWDFAPASYRDFGEHFVVEAVFGRWEEKEITCFRVLNDQQIELTLVFDKKARAWFRW